MNCFYKICVMKYPSQPIECGTDGSETAYKDSGLKRKLQQ